MNLLNPSEDSYIKAFEPKDHLKKRLLGYFEPQGNSQAAKAEEV